MTEVTPLPVKYHYLAERSGSGYRELFVVGTSLRAQSLVSDMENEGLSAEQIAELNQKLSTMRHDINNHLSLTLAALELIRRKQESSDRMLNTLSEQPPKITDAIGKFSQDFEAALGITRS